MLNGFEQSDLLEITPKKVARQPVPFTDNGMSFFNRIPGLEQFSGNTLKALLPTLILACGQLSVSNLYIRSVVGEHGVVLNHHTIDLATKDEEVFETSDSMTQLRSDGQTSMGPLFSVKRRNNGNLLSGAMAYGDVFSALTDDDILMWGNLTGYKNKNKGNSKSAVEIIRTFGADPEKPQIISADNRSAEFINPNFSGIRKMSELGAISTFRDPSYTVVAKDGRRYQAVCAQVNPVMKDIFCTLGDAIIDYEKRAEEYAKSGLYNIFNTRPVSEGKFGISPERNDMIDNTLRPYELLNFADSVGDEPLKSI